MRRCLTAGLVEWSWFGKDGRKGRHGVSRCVGLILQARRWSFSLAGAPESSVCARPRHPARCLHHRAWPHWQRALAVADLERERLLLTERTIASRTICSC